MIAATSNGSGGWFMSDELPTLDCPPEIVDLKHPLENFRAALGGKGPVRVVAMGSSSTAGLRNVVPYPARLELYLRKHYKDDDPHPNIRIDVFNRGRGGQEAPLEVARFNDDIFADNPSLVLWQVGTNAVFRQKEFNFDEVVASIAGGLALLRDHPTMDVILIDPQYVTAMLFDVNAELSERMVSAIRTAAEDAKVNLFQRWALMRHWHVLNNASFEQLLDPEDDLKLHQSNWSTMQVSLALTNSIIKAATPTV
jgi:hypothetical protein